MRTGLGHLCKTSKRELTNSVIKISFKNTITVGGGGRGCVTINSIYSRIFSKVLCFFLLIPFSHKESPIQRDSQNPGAKQFRLSSTSIYRTETKKNNACLFLCLGSTLQRSTTKTGMSYLQETFEERCHTMGAPSYLSFFTATVSILLLATNIPGNILLILAVARDPHKNLRSPFNYLMSNLAMADLIAGTVTGPLSVHYHIQEGLHVRLSTTVISLFHMSYFISCTASILSLASLATERYFAIQNPHNYRTKLTGKRILATVISIWSVALSLPFIYFEVGFITCSFILANTTVFLAVGTMSFTYGLMIWKFKTESRFHGAPRSEGESNNTNCLINTGGQGYHDVSNRHGNHRSKMVRVETRVTKMFLVVMAAVLGCYVPSTIFIYTMSFCETCSCESLHWFRDLECLFVLLNSSVNFFCYALRSPRFRQAFGTILRLPGNGKSSGCSASTSTPSSDSQALKTFSNQK